MKVSINNHRDHDINRGVELILKRRRREKDESKLVDKRISFDKVFSLFKREIQLKFEISFVKKI